MTTPNQIVFEETGKPAEAGDFSVQSNGEVIRCATTRSAEMWNERGVVAYRRTDAPADSRLLEVATAIYAARTVKGCRSVAFDGTNLEISESVAAARALIAACEGASQ